MTYCDCGALLDVDEVVHTCLKCDRTYCERCGNVDYANNEVWCCVRIRCSLPTEPPLVKKWAYVIAKSPLVRPELHDAYAVALEMVQRTHPITSPATFGEVTRAIEDTRKKFSELSTKPMKKRAMLGDSLDADLYRLIVDGIYDSSAIRPKGDPIMRKMEERFVGREYVVSWVVPKRFDPRYFHESRRV